MGKIENLKSWEKGQSGNPEGMKKGTLHRSTILNKFLSLAAKYENPANEGGELMEGTLEDKLWIAQIARALTGDTVAFKEIMDSKYGKIPANVVLSGDEDNPLQIEHTLDVKNMTDDQLRQALSVQR